MADIESAPAAAHGTAETVATVEARFTGEADIDVSPPDTSPRETQYTKPKTRGSFRRDAFVEPAFVEETRAYRPTRELYLDGTKIDADLDIAISAGRKGAAVADITVYNLDMSTWGSIDAPTRMTVRMGWDDETRVVFEGNPVIKRRRLRLQNRGYVLRGNAHRSPTIHGTVVRTYNKMSPHRIVEQLVSEIDTLGRGYISTESERLDGHYSLTGARSLSGWLDVLAKKASDQTGSEWVWYLEEGDLSFHPRKERTSDPITFSADGSLQRATPAGTAPSQHTQQPIEAVFKCEPIIKRGVVCRLADHDAIDEHELYRVASWVHESSSTTGRHRTTAMLDPLYKTVEDL